jgi:hypothetical protein
MTDDDVIPTKGGISLKFFWNKRFLTLFRMTVNNFISLLNVIPTKGGISLTFLEQKILHSVQNDSKQFHFTFKCHSDQRRNHTTCLRMQLAQTL